MTSSKHNAIAWRHTQRPVSPRTRTSALGAAGYRGDARSTGIPFVLVLVVLTIFLPVELSFYIFGLRLTAIRLIFLLITPFLLARLAQKVGAGRYRFVFSDLFVTLSGFWLIFAPTIVDGLPEALNHAGPDVLEFCIGYMTTRIMLSRRYEALEFAGLCCRTIAAVALTGLLDPLTGFYVIHNFARQLSGFNQVKDINDWSDAYRLGLLRATGPIEHPILYGFLCAIGLLIAANVPVTSRKVVIVACSLGAIFAFSSAPLQGCLLGLSLLLYGRLMARVPLRWAALMWAAAGGIIATFLVSNSPLGFIISHLIFDPASGYYRYWTWTRVIFYVSQSPWFGLGYGALPDEINHSINSLWLVLSINSGVPGAVLVALSLIGAVSLPTSGRRVELTPEESKLGTVLGILVFLIIYVSFTVDIWGSVWILIGVIPGMRAHLGELGQLQSSSRAVST